MARVLFCLTLSTLAACGGEPARSSQAPRVIALDEISLSSCPDRHADITLEASPVEDPVRSEAIGVWERWCDPANPGPHVPRGYTVFIYDGRYVSLVTNVEPLLEATPPIRMYTESAPFRLESRWQGDVLQARFPPWLLNEATEDEWLELARFEGERFVWPDNGELAYERGQPRFDTRALRALGEPREPLDYEGVATGRARGALLFRAIDAALHECVVASLARSERPTEGAPARLTVRVGADGGVVGAPSFESEDEALVVCATDALASLQVQGWTAPEEAGYRFAFSMRADVP